jgi:hypothetical protein
VLLAPSPGGRLERFDEVVAGFAGNQPGRLTGVAKTNTDVVAVGRTIGADGDAYATNPGKVNEQLCVLRADGSMLAVGGADRRGSTALSFRTAWLWFWEGHSRALRPLRLWARALVQR